MKHKQNQSEESVQTPTLINSESGKAISWAILFSAAVYGAYIYGGKVFLETHLNPFYQMVVLFGTVCVCIAFLGCGLHLFFLGGKSNAQLRKGLREQYKSLAEMIHESDQTIKVLEAELGRCAVKLTPRGLDCLSLARRIVRALDRRASEIEYLLSTGDAIDLIDADELCRKKLIITDNAIDALIGSDPVPPLAPEEWQPCVKRIFQEIEAERKKAA
ncbi:MAG: hypothetical protein U0136_18185 [Bdellovibrionota bacterium]